MKEKFVLDSGWIAINTGSEYLLEVKPIENSIFRTHKIVTIPREIFFAIKEGERNTKVLFQNFNLHNLIIEWESSRELDPEKMENTDTKFHGGGWFVEKVGEKYFIDYLSASQGGGNIRKEINEEIYQEACSGKYNLSELIKKYNLY